jgi:hypothetical protein
MPFLNIVKIKDIWHIPSPGNKITDCGENISEIEDKMRIGGDTQTRPTPSKHQLCVKCFRVIKNDSN